MSTLMSTLMIVTEISLDVPLSSFNEHCNPHTLLASISPHYASRLHWRRNGLLTRECSSCLSHSVYGLSRAASHVWTREWIVSAFLSLSRMLFLGFQNCTPLFVSLDACVPNPFVFHSRPSYILSVIIFPCRPFFSQLQLRARPDYEDIHLNVLQPPNLR